MHVFPKNMQTRAQWTTFVRIHRPNFQVTEYSALFSSLHFADYCYTRLKLSSLVPSETIEGNNDTSVGKTKEKIILKRGSVPTIHCSNKVPVQLKVSDRDRRKSRAVSVYS